MKRIIAFCILSTILIGCSKEKTINKDAESVNTINFDNNEIRYYEKIYYKSYGNPSSGKDFAEIKIEYPEIINSGFLSDSINNFIENYLLNLPFNEDQYSNFDEIADSLISNYLSVQHDFDDYHTGWYIHANSKITGAFNNIISITNENIIFTGGANTFYDLTYSNFNLESGELVTLENIVNDKDLNKLEKLGESIFFEDKNILNNSSIEDARFWFENNKFSLNNNFAITDSGLVFLYNLYEIAPRSEGTTKLFIPKDKLLLLTSIY